MAILKESKRTESACCAISGKAFSEETVLTASAPQKYTGIALSSAVSMNIDQRYLQDDSSVVGHSNDSPTYRILHNRTSTRSELSCARKITLRRLCMVVDDIDEGSKSLDDLENEYDGMQNVKTTSSDIVGGYEAVKKQDDTLTLRFIEKSNTIGILQERKQGTVANSQQKNN